MKNKIDGRKLVFEATIRNKKCKHQWKKVNTTMKAGNLLKNVEITFEYFLCPICNSTAGDPIYY